MKRDIDSKVITNFCRRSFHQIVFGFAKEQKQNLYGSQESDIQKDRRSWALFVIGIEELFKEHIVARVQPVFRYGSILVRGLKKPK